MCSQAAVCIICPRRGNCGSARRLSYKRRSRCECNLHCGSIFHIQGPDDVALWNRLSRGTPNKANSARSALRCSDAGVNREPRSIKRFLWRAIAAWRLILMRHYRGRSLIAAGDDGDCVRYSTRPSAGTAFSAPLLRASPWQAQTARPWHTDILSAPVHDGALSICCRALRGRWKRRVAVHAGNQCSRRVYSASTSLRGRPGVAARCRITSP